ncbi:MAG: hypothetical protein WEE66_01160 [Actinomycetota bacterium]
MQTPTKGPQDHLPVVPRAPEPIRPPKPSRFEPDLIIIPEATQPRRSALIAAVVGGLLALTLIIALVAYAIDQRQRAGELDTQLTTALDDQRVLIDAATASSATIQTLESRLALLEGDLQRARQGRSVLAASKQEIKAQLRDVRAELEGERARFQSYMGSPLGDGTHVGRLVAVGADQSPARVTTDVGRWFTGDAATQAAIEDGAIAAGDTRSRYFRNDDAAWRTLPVDLFATVTLLRWNGGTYEITFAELQRLSRSDSARAMRIRQDPFSMTVVDGRITSLRELRYN